MLLLVIVKKSSSKNLSANCWSTVKRRRVQNLRRRNEGEGQALPSKIDIPLQHVEG